MLGASDGQGRPCHTGVAEGANALAGALVDEPGRSPRARAAVGERVVGGRTDERGARASRAQGEDVAQRAPVPKLVTVSRTGEEVADLDPAGPLARLRQGERAGQVARHIVVAEGGHESRSPAGGDGVERENAPDEGSLPCGVEVVGPYLRRRRDRGHPELHERPDRGDDHIARLQDPRQVGRRGDIHLGHRRHRLEAGGRGQHLGSVSPHQRRRLAPGEQFPEDTLPGVSGRAQQDDPALLHDSALRTCFLVRSLAGREDDDRNLPVGLGLVVVVGRVHRHERRPQTGTLGGVGHLRPHLLGSGDELRRHGGQLHV